MLPPNLSESRNGGKQNDSNISSNPGAFATRHANGINDPCMSGTHGCAHSA